MLDPALLRLLAGDHRPVTPPSNMRRIAARIPSTSLRIFPGAHAFLFQSRRAFAAAVSALTTR